jgi:glycosidase
MSDFIFGTLATDALRLAHVHRLRAGAIHRFARTPRDPQPGQSVSIELTVGPAYFCDRAWIYWTDDGSEPLGKDGAAQNSHLARMEFVGAEWDTLLWGYVQRFRASLPPQPAGTVIRYRLAANSVQADDGACYAYYVADDPTPEWAYDAVVYQIFVDRFFPGAGRRWKRPRWPSGFYGGALRGIAEKLDYIADLGVNVLWLTPIFPSPSHHGYDATDYFDIEPRLGTKADLRELIDAAHARGIRLLLDFVPNHWSSQHATFQQAIGDPASPYRDWYTFTHWPDQYESFFGVHDLPQVNLRHPAARQHMLDAASYWLDFGVDGYRLDYAIGPTPDFWADFRRVTRQARPDCWTFGEVVEPSDSQLSFEGGLDGCLDFILLEGLRQAFAYGQWDAPRLADFLTRHEAYFPATFSRPSFLDNHDMNRFLWAAGNDKRRLRLAALCQLTLAGPPVIYYGTEVGLSQERDVRQGQHGIPEEARLPMLWDADQDVELLSFYRALIAIRRQEPALRRGTRRTLLAETGLLVYERRMGARSLVVALNLSEQPCQADLPGEWAVPLVTTGQDVTMEVRSDGVHISLPALSGVLLEYTKN